MKVLYIYLISLFLYSKSLFAGSADEKFQAGVENFTNKIIDIFLDPILAILITISTVYFIWGVVAFLANPEGANKDKGRQHMLWGMIGMFIIFSVWGFMNLIMNTVNSVA